jgi:hypothetical protein
VLAGVMIRRGGEYLAMNTVCSEPNTNPWARRGDRPLARTRRPRLRRHRHGRHRGDVLLRVPGRSSRGDTPPSTAHATPTARRTNGSGG